MSDTTTASGNPAWFDSLLSDYRAGVASSYLLHGVVSDYVDNDEAGMPLREWLANTLMNQVSVVCYSPDEGITFPGAKSPLETTQALATAARERFERVTGLGGAPMTEGERLLAKSGGASALGDTELPKGNAAIESLVTFLTSADGGEATDAGTILPMGTLLNAATATYAAAGDYVVRGLSVVGTDDAGQEVMGEFIGGDQTGIRALVIVDRLDLICPPADKGTMPEAARELLGLLHRVGTMREVDGLGNMLVMLSPSLGEVHGDLRTASSGIRALEISLPKLEERAGYLDTIIAAKDLELQDTTLDELAVSTAGLQRRHIEDIALRAVAGGGVLTREMVQERKREQIATEYDDVLEILEPDVDLSMIGGQDGPKRYFERYVARPSRSSDPRDRELMPSGIALFGPAGTGKTYLIRAWAKRLGWNAVLLKGDKIKGGIVGESERRLAKALSAIEGLAPCLVMMDEVDTFLKRPTGGSGGGAEAVEGNQFGRLLGFFSEPSHKGRIIPFAASNVPNQVDAALLRPGRFDVVIPILPPATPAERVDIVAKLLEQKGFYAGGPSDLPTGLDALGEATEGWTPAELGNLVRVAVSLARLGDLDDDLDAPLPTITEALVTARGYLKPNTRDIETMTLAALRCCNDVRLVPERWRALVAEMATEAAPDVVPVVAPVPTAPRGGGRRAFNTPGPR